MNKSTKGFSSIILIIFVFAIVIILSFLNFSSFQDSLILKSKNNYTKGYYITDSYTEIAIDDLVNKEGFELNNLDKNLFPNEDFELNYLSTGEKVDYGNIPSIKYKISTTYKGIENTSEMLFSIYNKIFYLEKPSIVDVKLNNEEKEYLEIFRSSIFKNGINFTNTRELITLEPNEIIASKTSPSIYYYNGKEFIETKYLTPTYNYIFDGQSHIGFPDSENGVVKLKGNIYISGSIFLNTDLIIEGIVVSNNGVVETNGNSLRIDGIFIETGDSGSFPNVVTNYNSLVIKSNIDQIENAKYKELLIRRHY